MLKVSRKSEYGLIALRYIWEKNSLCTAREISDNFFIPLENMAKILQSLTRAGLLSSVKGVQGGYRLARNPSEISIADVIEIIDGPIGIVDCETSQKTTCVQYCRGVCNIKKPLGKIQNKFKEFLNEVTLVDMV